jgi:hypothetical protein
LGKQPADGGVVAAMKSRNPTLEELTVLRPVGKHYGVYHSFALL